MGAPLHALADREWRGSDTRPDQTHVRINPKTQAGSKTRAPTGGKPIASATRMLTARRISTDEGLQKRESIHRIDTALLNAMEEYNEVDKRDRWRMKKR